MLRGRGLWRLLILCACVVATTGGNLSGTGNEDGGAISGNLSVTDVADGMTTPNFTVSTPAVNGNATIDSVTGDWIYTPAADFFGSDSFVVTYTDDDGNSAEETIVLTVLSANDEPSFTLTASHVSRTIDGPQVVPGFAQNIDPGNVDDAGQELTFVIVSNDNPGLFDALPVISQDGTLFYTAAAGNGGAATIQVQLMDDGGTANGGSDSSSVLTFTITIGVPDLGSDTGAVIDGKGNLIIIDSTGGNSNLTVRRVTVNSIDYLSISERRGTMSSDIAGAIQFNSREVRIAMSAFTGDLVFDLFGGDDRITFIGDFGNLPGGLQVIGGDGFDLVNFRGSSFVLSPDSDVQIESESIISSRRASLTVSGTGSITLDANQAFAGRRYDAVNLGATTLQALGTGDVTILGVSGNVGNGNDGVRLLGVTVSVDSGDVRIEGTSAAGSNSAGIGVLIGRSSSIGQQGSGGGTILIDGQSLGGGARTKGLSISGRVQIFVLAAGRIDMDGMAASGRGNNIGVSIAALTRITSESGDISIDGQGGDGGRGNVGLSIAARSEIVSQGGNLEITGISGSGTAANTGAVVSGRVLISTIGIGTIELSGTGSGTATSGGVRVLGASRISTELGGITIEGLSTTPVVTAGVRNVGLDINRSTIEITGAAGSGALLLIGQGEGGLDRNGGIRLTRAELTVAGSGALTANGEVTASGRNANFGLMISGRSNLTTATGNVRVEGVSRGIGGSNQGAQVLGSSTISSGGTLSVVGRSALTSLGNGNTGLLANRGTFLSTGDATLDGQSGGGSRSNQGADLKTVTIASSGGSITIIGISHGDGNTNRGVQMLRTTVNAAGDLSVTGSASLSAQGKGNSGIIGTVANLESGGTIELQGTGGTGTVSNEGLRLVRGFVKATDALTIVGIASTEAINGNKNNHGVYLSRVASLEGGIGSSVSGTGGLGVLNNHGIFADVRTGLGGQLTLTEFVGTAGTGTGSLDRAGSLFGP